MFKLPPTCKAMFMLCFISYFFSLPLKAQYCAASGDNCSGNDITNATVQGANGSGFNNTTSCEAGGYADYTSLFAYVIPGSSYQASTISNANGYFAGQISVWVDWNGNGSFSDTGENIFTSSTSQAGAGAPIPFTITPPPGTSLGTKRMRIRTASTTPPLSPCGYGSIGEVEDYNIIVSNNPPPPPGYCAASGDACGSDLIYNVTLAGDNGGINNSTGCEPTGYGDYTNLMSVMTVGKAYQLSVDCDHEGYFTGQIAVWIDYNNNNRFDDNGELVASGSTSQGFVGTPFTAAITPPAGTSNGKKRMRVRTASAQPPLASCGYMSIGEVEDYTVAIVNPSGPCNGGTALVDTFIGPGNKWKTAANWKLGIAPDKCIDAFIPNGYTVTIDTFAMCHSIHLGSAASVLYTAPFAGAPPPSPQSNVNFALNVYGNWQVDAGATFSRSTTQFVYLRGRNYSISGKGNVSSVYMSIWDSASYFIVNDSIALAALSVAGKGTTGVTNQGNLFLGKHHIIVGGTANNTENFNNKGNFYLGTGILELRGAYSSQFTDSTFHAGTGLVYWNSTFGYTPAAPGPSNVNSNPTIHIPGNVTYYDILVNTPLSGIRVEIGHDFYSNTAGKGPVTCHNFTLHQESGGDITAGINFPFTVNNTFTIDTNTVFQPFGGYTAQDQNMTVNGDWISYGSFSNPSPSSQLVTLSGTTLQQIGGTSVTRFNLLTINNTGMGIVLNQDAQDSAGLTMTAGNINLNGHILDLGSVANISGESNSNRIYGTSGIIKASNRKAAAGTNIAGMGATITSPNSTNINIYRGHAVQTVNGVSSVLRYYDIFSTPDVALNAVLQFAYFAKELNGKNKNTLSLFHSSDNGTSWNIQDCTDANTIRDTVNNNVQTTGINTFGTRWTVAPKPGKFAGIAKSNQIICAGTSATLTLTGYGGTIQWQDSSGSHKWQNIGQTSNNVSVSPLVNTWYRAMVSSSTCKDSSNSVKLQVDQPPVAGIAGTDQNICAGSSASLSLSGSSGSIQWQQSSDGITYTNIIGATSTTLTINPSGTSYYRAVLSRGVCSNATSNKVTVTVIPIPPSPSVSIADPQGTTICGGDNVKYTATPINGGISPSYTWRINGSNVGTNSSTYSTTTLNNGDVVDCIITVNTACSPTPTAVSNSINMTVLSTPVTPSVSISANPGNNICAGVFTSFTATPVNGGSTPTYHWQVNSLNVGANSNIYTSSTLNNGDVVSCIMTSALTCVTTPSAASNNITMNVTANVSPVVSIAASPAGNQCAGTNITFTAAPTNGGSTPNYQWKLNGSNVGSSNSNIYSSSTLNNGDVVQCIMSSSILCVTTPTATSNSIAMSITPNATPALSITASPGTTICQGDNAHFTATPVNAGATPSYQWQLNGGNVGTNSNTYSNTILSNGDVVSCIMTSGLVCVTKPTASDSKTMTVIAGPVTPSVSISANPGNNICAGVFTSFTATPVNGGSTPTYHWQVNSLNVGANSNIYTSSTLNNGDVVSCIMTSALTCVTTPSAASNNITMNVTANVSPVVSIAASPAGNQCAGTNITFTAAPTNGGSTPNYQWKLNGSNVGSSNSNIYSSSTLNNGDVVQCIMSSSILCVTTPTVASNSLTMSITPNVTPALSIIASPGTTICQGDNAHFTATPVNGGATPSYQWQLNGGNVGTNSNTYSNTILSNGDVVSCIMTSGLVCVTKPTASDSKTMTVIVGPVTPSVSISANPGNNICAGVFTSFTATPVNGGSTPTYHWQVNSLNVGANSNIYTSSTLNNGDVVSCIMTSALTCVTTPSAASNNITMNVTANVSPVVSIAASPAGNQCAGTNITFTAAPTNGGSTPNYQWKLNGSNVGSSNSNIYSSSTLNNGDVVQCVMGSSILCVTTPTATSNSLTLTINALPTPTISTSGFTTFCKGDSVTLKASGGVAYLWNTGETTTSITVKTSNNYKVTVINSSGCSSVASQQVFVSNKPVAKINSGGKSSICQGETLELVASGDVYYLWSTGETTSNIFVSTTNTYTVRVGNINGCTDVASKVITVNSLPNAVITPNGTTTFCFGNTVGLSATLGTGNIYRWSNGATEQTINVGVSGTNTYTVLVTSAAGCQDLSQELIVQVNSLPAKPIITSYGSSLVSSSTKNNQWFMNGLSITGATSQNYKAQATGFYKVMVTDNNGCSNISDSIWVSPTGIANKQAGSDLVISAYPNPFNETITIKYALAKEDKVSIEVMDITGKVIARPFNDKLLDKGEHEYLINANDYMLRQGIYLVKVISSQQMQILKINYIEK